MGNFNLINSFNNIFRYNNINYFDEGQKEGERIFLSQILSSEFNKTFNLKIEIF